MTVFSFHKDVGCQGDVAHVSLFEVPGSDTGPRVAQDSEFIHIVVFGGISTERLTAH